MYSCIAVRIGFLRGCKHGGVILQQVSCCDIYVGGLKSSETTRIYLFKVLVEWIQFVYELVAILLQTIIQKNPNQKFATEAEILTLIITLRWPCEVLGRLRRPMIEWRHETVRWRH